MSIVYKTSFQHDLEKCGVVKHQKRDYSINAFCEDIIENADSDKIIRAKNIVEVNGINDFECLFGEIFIDYEKYATITFNSFVNGILNEKYKTSIYIIKERKCTYYECECEFFKSNHHSKSCKHVVALAMWINKNYEFDYNNYTLEVQKDDIRMEYNNSVKIYDGEVSIDVINDINGLRNTLSNDICLRISMFEKVCRYLEKGVLSYDDFENAWSDKKVRKFFIDNNLDFDNFICNTLKLLCYNIGRKDDFSYHKDTGYHSRCYDNYFATINERIKHIKNTVVNNYREMETQYDFIKIIKSYNIITKFKVGSHVFQGKYIFVPNYIEFLAVDADNVPLKFFNEFKLGKSSFKDGFALKNEEKNILIIYNWVRGFKPTFEE